MVRWMSDSGKCQSLDISSSKENVKLQLGWWMHTAFLTFYTLINHVRKLLDFFFFFFWSVTSRHRLKYSLGGVTTKIGLQKFEIINRSKWLDNNKNIQKILQIRLSYFLFSISHEVVFRDFDHFLETANLRNISLLVKTITTACTIPSQKQFVLNLIFISVVLGSDLKENRCSEYFYKTKEMINEGFTC